MSPISTDFEIELDLGGNTDPDESLLKRIIKSKQIAPILEIDEEDPRRPVGQAFSVLNQIIAKDVGKFSIIEARNAKDFSRLLQAVKKVPLSMDVPNDK